MLATTCIPSPTRGIQIPLSSPPARRTSRRSARFCFCSRHEEDLKGQTVAVLGLGVSGRAAARLALARGASVVAIDRNEQWLPPKNEFPLLEHSGVRVILGDCDGHVLESVDRVVVSPGVPIENYGLLTLLHSGRQVMSELDFAAEVLPYDMKILAVTGTNGKSTVTTFAGQILHQLGINAFVGGNLGIPLSDAAIKLLQPSPGEDIYQAAVVEVSSAQMEIPNSHFHPSVALVLNLTPDHLKRHKTMENYAAIKCLVFSHMKHHKLAILPIENPYLKDAFSSYAKSCNVAWIGDFPGIRIDLEEKVAKIRNPILGLDGQVCLRSLKAMGSHNYHNAAVAAFAVLGLDFGANTNSINATIDKLSLLPHRIQVVCRDDCGVTWVDDSKATNVGATYAGLMALKEHNLIVLLGGVAKPLDASGSTGFEELIELLKHQRGVVTFGSSGTIIHRALCDGSLDTLCIKATNLEDAVSYARRIARYGDTVILSPGCASFDEFRDFEHRGKTFQQLVLS